MCTTRHKPPQIAFISTDFGDTLPEEYQGSHEPEEPLDLMYAAAAASSWADCRIVDIWQDHDDEFIRGSDALVFSTTNSYLQWNNHPLGLGLFQRVWQRACEALDGAAAYRAVIGPHVPAHRAEILGMGADAAFIGEAELAVVEHLRRVLTGHACDSDGARTKETEPSIVQNLDDLPRPYYEHTVEKGYAAHNCPDAAIKFGHLYETSRGCPFMCSFCNTITHRRQYRTKSPAKVFDDLSQLADLTDRQYIYFIDESFGFDDRWFEELLVVLKELQFTYGCQGNLLFMTMDKLAAMSAAGFRSVEFGLETGSERLLRIAGKNNRLADAADLIAAAVDLGLNPLLFINVGLPGEDERSLKETLDFLCSLPPRVRMSVAMPTPYVGTKLYKLGIEQGLIPAGTPAERNYRFTGRIGHNLGFSDDSRSRFLAKYGPNNYLLPTVLEQFESDLCDMFELQHA